VWQERAWSIPAPLRFLNDRPPRILLLLGTWALTVYLVHQPILMGALWLLRRIGL
jgi:peptidoglycan/LPS O-acetylase OafA/YrhL